MKYILTVILITSIIGCTKETYIEGWVQDNPFGEGKGNVTFYTDASILLNEYPMKIIVDQQTVGTLTKNYLNFSSDHPQPTEPFCGEILSGMVVNYVGSAGTHSFKAIGAFGGSSSGSFTITADQCDKKKIHQ